MIINGATIVGARVVDGSVLTNNLLIWLDASNASSYSGSGTTVTDLSGNGYTHTLSSAGIYTVLNGIKCFDCSTTGVVTVNGTGPTLPTTGFTYMGWGRLLNSTANWRTLWRTLPDDHPILIEVGTNRLGMYDNNTGGQFQYSGYTATGLADTWVHWATTGTNSAQSFYINGQLVGTTAYGTGGNRHNEWGSTGGGQPFGYVANMFLYNTILTAEQIQQNYYGSRRNFGVLSYTSTGSTTWVAPLNVTQVQYLVVGGGGGAGNGYDNAGGGGGGAGMVLTGNIAVTPGTSYTVTVGAGGAGGADARTNNPGNAGNSSVFSSVTSLGGGAGAGSRTGGTAGAAQVGSTTAATGGSGSGGGFGGKGGGGSTTAGSANSGATGGAGGSGTSSSITGSAVTYGAGGAGGGAGAPTTDGANGGNNTGNGGGGGKSASTDSAKGGDGGSGIVVLSYNQE